MHSKNSNAPGNFASALRSQIKMVANVERKRGRKREKGKNNTKKWMIKYGLFDL